MLSTFRLASRQAIIRHVASRSSIVIRQASTWADVPQGPSDAILGITEAFNADRSHAKINLGVGAYRNDAGMPYVLTSIKIAENRVIRKGSNKEYAPITGIPEFNEAAAVLAYGQDSSALDRLAITQSISGTGALRIGGAFLQRFYPGAKKIYIPNPSWANHAAVFKDSGLEVEKYSYFNPETLGLDFDRMIIDIKAAPNGSIFLLHACAHNPTGVDPTVEQWKAISDAMKAGEHYAFFDMAYQGFATGDTDRDAFPVRHFVEQGHNICLAQSFAKNMGLYGERVGAFSIVCANPAEKARVESQIKILVRPLYSNPPLHGARIAAAVLNSSTLNPRWRLEVGEMAQRIITMRASLKTELENLGSTHDWSHITNQIGMFAYTGLTPEQMDKLAKKHSVYATRDGRISIAGITSSNVKRLAAAIHAVKP